MNFPPTGQIYISTNLPFVFIFSACDLVKPEIKTEILKKHLYSARMRENTDQKNFEYGHFLRSASYIVLKKPNVSVS